MLKRIDLSVRQGRINIRLQAEWIGSGLLVKLTGGREHIGALALATPGKGPETLSSPGHRERELACKVAEFLRDRLNCEIAVIAGIHYDCITASEIEMVYNLSFSLIEQYIKIWDGLHQC